MGLPKTDFFKNTVIVILYRFSELSPDHKIGFRLYRKAGGHSIAPKTTSAGPEPPKEKSRKRKVRIG